MVAQAIVVDAVVVTAGFALKGIVCAIKGIYGIAGKIDDFLDDHIEKLKQSDNSTIARTGQVIEMAKCGFGVGYITPVVIIAVGQFLLGNTLAAATTVVTALTLTNPIAMTCAAFGAILYGWSALSDTERQEIVDNICDGMDVGVELVKSIIRFVIEKTNEVMSSKNVEEFKSYIGSVAAVFGKTLGDVTHKIADVVSDTFGAVKRRTGGAVDKTIDIAAEAYKNVSETAEKATASIKGKMPKSSARDDPFWIQKD